MIHTTDPVLRAIRDEASRLQCEYDEEYESVWQDCEIQDREQTEDEARDLRQRRRDLLEAQAYLEGAVRARIAELTAAWRAASVAPVRGTEMQSAWDRLVREVELLGLSGTRLDPRR